MIRRLVARAGHALVLVLVGAAASILWQRYQRAMREANELYASLARAVGSLS